MFDYFQRNLGNDKEYFREYFVDDIFSKLN